MSPEEFLSISFVVQERQFILLSLDHGLLSALSHAASVISTIIVQRTG